MSNEEISAIVETGKVPEARYALVAVPDTGLVGIIAAGHIVRSKNMKEIGYVRSAVLPPLVVIHDGEPKSPVRIYSDQKILALISETPLPSSTYRRLAVDIAKWSKEKKVNMLVSLTGIAVQNRLEIEKPQVFGLGSSAEIREFLKSRNIPMLEEGFLAGPHALILNRCIEEKVPIAILLVQSHSQFPDPGATVSLIECLNDAFQLDVEIQSLKEQADEFRLKLRELMQRTQQSMTGMQKSQEEEIPAFYR